MKSSTTTVPRISIPDVMSKAEKMSNLLARTSLQPIVFYGKVADQHGHPVAGVKVEASVKAPRYFMDENWEKYFTTTNGDGRFQFSSLHGQDMGIFLEKKGYEFKSNNKRFSYSALTPAAERHRPDSSEPVVFKMWKQYGAEPLIKGDKFFGIKGDGTPFTIDLLNGRKTEGKGNEGDLIVTINQPQHIANGEKFNWSFTIEAISGGLIDAADTQYANEAPAKGYESQISQEVKTAGREWSEVVRKMLFVKSRSGNQFARVIAEIHANYQDAAVFSIHYLVNPKPGSRNLEYDPAKQASAH